MAYVRMHETPQEGEKTAKQWQQKNYIVKKGRKGNVRWVNNYHYDTAVYYTADDVRLMTEKEKNAVKIEKIKQKTYKQAYQKGFEEGRKEGAYEERRNTKEIEIEVIKSEVYGTAREWLKRGRIVIDNPQEPIVNGDEKFYENFGFFYYHITDTIRCSEEKAKELLEMWDKLVLEKGQKYKGLKWW